MRILIFTHAPLSLEFGASSLAMNLGDALKKRGHDVVLWSPYPYPEKLAWWKHLDWARKKLQNFIKNNGLFDIIDCPPCYITKKTAKASLLVVRSEAPYLIFAMNFIRNYRKRGVIKDIIHFPAFSLYTFYYIILTINGWRKAKYIFCLGSLEFIFMNKMFPYWKKKLRFYFGALPEKEQKEMLKIRLERQKNVKKTGIKFLWIGRWVFPKGPDILAEFINKRIILFPQDTFTIAGCGNDIPEDFRSKFVNSGKAAIIPFFDRKQLPSILASHDVGLFTSRIEGWGISLNEMLESGMPVFATLAGGVHDLKPYFKDAILSFSDTENFKLETLPKVNISDEYYRVFNWNNLAVQYEFLNQI